MVLVLATIRFLSFDRKLTLESDLTLESEQPFLNSSSGPASSRHSVYHQGRCAPSTPTSPPLPRSKRRNDSDPRHRRPCPPSTGTFSRMVHRTTTLARLSWSMIARLPRSVELGRRRISPRHRWQPRHVQYWLQAHHRIQCKGKAKLGYSLQDVPPRLPVVRSTKRQSHPG